MSTKTPSYHIDEIPDSKDPRWNNENDRHTFEEDLRIHIYDAIDYMDPTIIPDEERLHWESVIAALGSLAAYYKMKGYHMHVH